MSVEHEPGVLESFRRQVIAHADALKTGATESLRQRLSDFREAVGPEKAEPGAFPDRPFGREEGGEDVKHIVWTGHTVQTPEGRSYFGAAGLTQGGYYRAAEVQVYGSDEQWHWQADRYADKEDAIASAEGLAANRLAADAGRGPALGEAEPAWREFFEKEKANMAEIPDHIKAEADRATADLNKTQMTIADAGPSVHQLADAYDTKAMEAQREQQRQNALDRKGPESTPEPGR